MAPGRKIKKKASMNVNSESPTHQLNSTPGGVVSFNGTKKTDEAPSASMKTHDRFRRVLSTIPQSPTTSSTATGNDNIIPLHSRGSSPETEATPRPLRVLKGRRSFLKLAELASSTTSIPMFNGQRRTLSAEHAAQVVPQPVDMLFDIVSRASSPLSSPTRTFMGLKITSPKPRVASPDTIPRNVLQPLSPDTTKGFGSRTISSGANNSNHVLVPDINKQNIKSTDACSSTKVALSSPFAPSAYIPNWMNWKQRSHSDGQSSKTRPIFNKQTQRVMSALPGTIYEGGRTDSKSDLAPPLAPELVSPTRALRRAISAGPAYLSLNQSACDFVSSGDTEVCPNNSTTSSIAPPKPNILTKMLSSAQDLPKHHTDSHEASTCSTTDISRQTSISITDTISCNYGNIVGKERIIPEVTTTQNQGKNNDNKPVTKGSFRSRKAFGSIRRRFGSSTEKSTDSSETKCTLTSSDISTPEVSLFCPWVHPPMLKPHISIFSELVREHVEGGKEFWVCVELGGRVSYTHKSADPSMRNAMGGGLDVAIIMDLSAHASPSTFNQTKDTARKIITSLTSSDNVSLIAYTSIQSSPSVEAKYPLTRLTSSAQAKLLEFIDGLFSHAQRQGIITHDIKTLIATTMADLTESLEKNSLSRMSNGTAHVLLLASTLKAGDLPDELISQGNGRVQLHFLGMGPLVKIEKCPGPGSWVLNSLITSESELCSPELQNIPGSDVIGFLNILRCGIDVGTLSNIHLELLPGEGCKVIDMIGQTNFKTLAPGETKVVCVKLRVGPYPMTAPETPANTPEKKKTLPEVFSSRSSSIGEHYVNMVSETGQNYVVSERKLLERQLAATLGVIETKALGVSVKYEHSCFGENTEITARKTLNIQRFDGDGNWSLGRSRTITQRSPRAEGVEAISVPQHGSNRTFNPLERPLSVTDEEEVDDFIKYARTLLAKKVAEKNMGMAEEHPKKALRAVEEWGVRGRGVHAIASELEWRVKMKDDEVETDRTIKCGNDELIRAGAKRDVEIDSMSDQLAAFTGSMRGAIMNTTPREESIRSSYSWRSGALYGGSLSQPMAICSNPDVDLDQSDNNNTAQSPGTRTSSVVIHRVPYPRESSPISQNAEINESPHPEEVNASNRMSKSPSSHHRTRQDHVDEAGRVWKELAESKLGLRRDVRPGRYRGGVGPAIRHSRSSSVDFFFERDKDREHAEVGGVKLKKQKRAHRRLKKQQPMKRNSRGLIRNIGHRNQMLVRKSRSFGSVIGSEVDHLASAQMDGLRGKSNSNQEYDLAAQDGEWVTQSDIERCDTSESMQEAMEGFEAMTPPVDEGGFEASGTIEDTTSKSNRDTMKSLLTLRDVKETDFSPWVA